MRCASSAPRSSDLMNRVERVLIGVRADSPAPRAAAPAAVRRRAPEREARERAAGREAADRPAQGRGRQALLSAEHLRRVRARQQGRHLRDQRRRQDDAGERAPEHPRRGAHGRPAPGAERGLQHRRRDDLRPARRGHDGVRRARRWPRHRARPRRRGARDQALAADAPREAEGGRQPAREPAHRLRRREAAEVDGRPGRARGSSRRHLRGHRRDSATRSRCCATRSSCRICTPSVQAVQPVAAEGHPALRPAGLRQDHDRQGGGEQPRAAHPGDARRRSEELLPEREGPRAPEQVRRRDRAQDPRGVQERAREGGGGRAGRHLLRRDGLAVPHARLGHLVGHGGDGRRAVPVRDRRRRVTAQRDRDRRLEPPGSDRSRGAAPGPPRPEGQGAPARERRARARSSPST